MRIAHIVMVCILGAGCQPTRTDDTATPPAGTTTYTRGAPDTARSDTTRTGGTAATPSGAVTLTLDRTSYPAGATVTMRVASQTRDTLGYNQCSSRTVERQQGATWIVHPEPERICTMELRLLMPNETQTATTDLPANLRGGTYRIVLLLSRQSASNPGSVRAVSGNFAVN